MSLMSKLLAGTAMGLIISAPLEGRAQEGVFDFLDPCKKAEARFDSTRQAVNAQVREATTRLSSWNEDPTKIPDNVLVYYREAVKAFAFKTWQDSGIGAGTINSWKAMDPNVDVMAMFFRHVYPSQVDQALETRLARAVFQKDYSENIKPKMDKDVAEVAQTLQTSQQNLDSACSKDVFSQVMRSTIGRAVLIVNGNFDAAANEKGEIAKAVRAISGVSLTDIFEKGLAGGENSEINKLRRTWQNTLTSVGIGENHELRKALRAIDPTNLNVPTQVQVTIDKDSLNNACRNVTLGLACR